MRGRNSGNARAIVNLIDDDGNEIRIVENANAR